MLSSLSSFTSENQESVTLTYLEMIGGSATMPCKDVPPGTTGSFNLRVCTDDNNKFFCDWKYISLPASQGSCTISVE